MRYFIRYFINKDIYLKLSWGIQSALYDGSECKLIGTTYSCRNEPILGNSYSTQYFNNVMKEDSSDILPMLSTSRWEI